MKNKKIMSGEAVPWLWLQETEGGAEAEKCGCAIVRNYNGGGPAMFLCPAHEAGPRLKSALAGLLRLVSAFFPAFAVRFPKQAKAARAAIAKARTK